MAPRGTPRKSPAIFKQLLTTMITLIWPYLFWGRGGIGGGVGDMISLPLKALEDLGFGQVRDPQQLVIYLYGSTKKGTNMQ